LAGFWSKIPGQRHPARRAGPVLPVESSHEHVERIPVEARPVEIEGAQHGLAVHNHPGIATRLKAAVC
jgi:hypothetical protein